MKWRERVEQHITRGEEATARAEATMLSQAEREMDLKTFIRKERIRADRWLREFEHRMAEAGDQLRANTAATWAMVDEIRGRGSA